MYQDPKSRLWLPSNIVREEVPHPAMDFAYRYVSVSPGWFDLYGVRPTWDDFLERIRKLPVEQTLFHLSQINIALGKHPGAPGQVGICKNLFVQEANDLLRRLDAFAARPEFKGALRTPSPFNEAQLLMAAKLALAFQPLDFQHKSESLEPLGQALLMLNDLVSDKSSKDLEATSTDMVASALFHFDDVLVHGMARAYDLFLRDRPELRAKHGLDLTGTLRATTGLEPDLLWALIFFLWAHFESLTPERVGIPFSADAYLGHFTAEERAQVIRLVSSSVEVMAVQLAGKVSTEDIRLYDVLEFANSPIVSIGGKDICLSVRLLKNKLITGLHYFFLNLITDKKTRDLYLIYRGEVVEQYVDELLRRCFPAASGIYIGPEQFSRSDGGSICDGALYYGDAIVFLEVKGKQFDLRARTGVRQSLQKKFEDIIYEGAKQLDETERAFRAGTLKFPGVDPSRTHTVFPLLILLEHLVLNPLTYRAIAKELDTRRLLSGTGVAPIQIINLADLEHMETGIDAGLFGLREVLQNKIASEALRGASLKNHLLENHREFFAKNQNPYLRRVFDERYERAEALLKERGGS
jgi:hypothetical protein